MSQTAANLMEFVLPDAPLRQWVLTVPHPLRPLAAHDRRLMPAIYRIFYDSIQRLYRALLVEAGIADGRTSSVTAIQRASSDLRLNPHLHGVFLDGVFAESVDGALVFTSLPGLSDMDVCELLVAVVARVVGHPRRQGLLPQGGQGGDGLAADGDPEQLVLATLATAAVSGRSLAGP